jgi:UDP-N-acetyl-D-glucosamine dehydrogenase
VAYLFECIWEGGVKVVERRVHVAIVGQGYVGLPLAVAAAESGCVVVGIEEDASRVAKLNRGSSPIGDVSDHDLASVVKSGAYVATVSYTEVKTCEVIVLCVPTPYHHDAPDLSYVERAAREVGSHLSTGALIILESTTYPGTTDEVVLTLVQEASGMVPGRDFDLAFSPERIDPGNPVFGLRNTPKIVGGATPHGAARAAEFYGRFVERVIPVSTAATAEMAKLLENTFRHINIALVNELAILCADMGIDIWEVIDAAASKPFGFMPFYPGPGVGGHCIPVDPMYLSWRVRQLGGSAKFIELARDINDAMPLYCVSRIQDLLNDRGHPLRDSRVLVIGVTYKKNVADVRESPAVPLINALIKKGCIVSFHDPYVDELALPGGRRLTNVDLDDALRDSIHCIVIVTPHAGIDYVRLVETGSLIYDTRNFLNSNSPNVVRL